MKQVIMEFKKPLSTEQAALLKKEMNETISAMAGMYRKANSPLQNPVLKRLPFMGGMIDDMKQQIDARANAMNAFIKFKKTNSRKFVFSIDMNTLVFGIAFAEKRAWNTLQSSWKGKGRKEICSKLKVPERELTLTFKDGEVKN